MLKIPEAKPELVGEYTDLKDLRKKIKKILISNFKYKKIVNIETKFEIGFDKRGFKKLLTGGEIKLLCLTILENIIITGSLYNVEKDTKNRPGISAFYKFKTKVKVYNINYEFRFSVRNLKGNKFLYSGNIDIKKPL